MDGLGDKGIKEFGGRTPLQVAHTPNMDILASIGANGSYHSSRVGMPMPSEMAHFGIFGYGPAQFPGRGIIEAVGEGLPLSEGDVAILARTFSVREEKGIFILKKEKLAIAPEECTSLHKSIASFDEGGMTISFHPTSGIAGILVIKGPASMNITDSNPITEGRPIMKILPRSDAGDPELAEKTAAVLNRYTRWSFDVLSANPANISRVKKGLLPVNIVGLQRPGKMTRLTPFEERWGLKALCIASGSIYHGLCSMLSMDVCKAEDTGNPGKDLLDRLRIAKDSAGYDFIYVHTKAPDEAAHKRDPLLKVRIIEELDKAMKFVLDEIVPEDDILFVMTSDHSTASTGTMIHSGETVPLVMKGLYTRRDEVSSFDEISCCCGCLGQMRGKEIMYMILNLLDKGKLAGLMDDPVDRPYSPGIYTPLRSDDS